MKTALIIVEEEILEKPIYFGKSGDLSIIDYFLRNNFSVYLINANDLQKNIIDENKIFLVENNVPPELYYNIMQLECENIINRKTPSTSGEDFIITLKLQEKSLKSVSKYLLISRAMPQSINKIFQKNFEILAQNAVKIPQNMEHIYLYKDKVIPYLLQKNNDNIQNLYKTYLPFEKEFFSKTSSLALNTNIIDLSNPIGDNLKEIEKIQGKICIKPFNLFGGLGVKIFDNALEKEKIAVHLENIKSIFVQYKVSEKHLVLIQEAVKFPEFGDVRVLISYGKFIGAFKKVEPNNYIHNTMYGGIIEPICNEKFEFHQGFEMKYHKAFHLAINELLEICNQSSFLKNEFICGYDLLLTEEKNIVTFKLTETNIACPTGFPFMDASLLVNKYGNNVTLVNVKEYFKNNKRTIEKIMLPHTALKE